MTQISSWWVYVRAEREVMDSAFSVRAIRAVEEGRL